MCGDVRSFALTGDSRAFCVLYDHDEADQIVLTMSATSDSRTGMELALPGHSADEAIADDLGINLGWADENETIAAALRSGGDPDLDLYRDLALPVVVLSYGPSDVVLELDCE